MKTSRKRNGTPNRHPARSSLALAFSLTACALLGPGAHAQAEPKVVYEVRFAAPQTQRLEVDLTLREVARGELVLHLPTWRPGKYQILDPSSALTPLAAWNGSNEALAVRKTAKDTWRIDVAQAGTVRVHYGVYANELGLRTRHVDSSHAFLSGSSVFVYSPSFRAEPLDVRFDLPPGWQLASGLEASGRSSLRAPNYDVLVDSPIEAGIHDTYSYLQDGKSYEIVVWPAGVAISRDNLLADFAEITAEHSEIFGSAPFDRYVFLVHASSGARGGTEHLNSTIMQAPLEALEGSIERTKAYRGFLGLTSHEFFHTWNVKQLRPEGIQPYDYQSENYSSLFWVAEGTTSYYAPLTLARRKRIKVKQYLKELGDQIDAVRQRPGSRAQSVAESSFDAWIKFNRPSADAVNTTVSFYRRGALVSLVLDAWVRRESGGQAHLDHVLRALYERHPLESGGFTENHLRQALREAAGADPDPLFARHVHGTEPLPLEQALETFGIELYRKEPKKDDDTEGSGEDSGEDSDESQSEEGTEEVGDPDVAEGVRAELGLALHDRDGRTLVRSVLADGPAFLAGVQPGDELIAVDNRRLRTKDLDTRLELYSPGETVELLVLRRDLVHTFEVELAERPEGKWTLKHTKEPTSSQKQNYSTWLELEFPEQDQAPK